MGVTIKDIAKKTGLSITTVSLVLNNKKSRISEKTKQIVESAAQEMQYSPNQVAKSLATKRTNCIGLVLPAGLYYPYADLLQCVEHACVNSELCLSIALPEADGESCMEAINNVLRRGIDGLLFDPSLLSEAFYQRYIELVLTSSIPISSLGSAGANLLSNSILPDHRQGGYVATSHLLGAGHRRIGCILGSQELSISSDFYAGCCDALEEAHAPSEDFSALFMDYTFTEGYKGLDILLKRPITAVVAGSDSIAAGILRRAYELKLHVPSDLSVIGYGNASPGYESYVPLTTVSLHFDRIARKAINAIKRRYQNGQNATPELISPSLIVRESTAEYPAST